MGCSLTISLFSLTRASRIRSAWSISTQKTIVFEYLSVLFEELSYLLCHNLRSFLDDEFPIEILLLVNAVIDRFTPLSSTVPACGRQP